MNEKDRVNNFTNDVELEVKAPNDNREMSTPNSNENISNSFNNHSQYFNDDNSIINNQHHNHDSIQKNNNPALGQRKMSNRNNDDLSNSSSTDKLNQTPNNNQLNSSLNQNNNKPNSSNNVNNANNANQIGGSNPLPGANLNSNKKKDNAVNNSVKPKGEPKKSFNPRKSIQDYMHGNLAKNIKSVLGLGNKKDENDNKGSSRGIAIDTVKGGLIGKWLMMPISAKITVGASAGVIAVIAIILFAVLGATTGVVIGSSMCDTPSYTANSSDSMSFLCNMSSPFGPDGETGEYSVTSTSGRRVPPPTQNGYGSNFHEGTDVTGIKGKNLFYIYAVADGKVVQAGWNGGYGNSVLINHNDAFFTRYGHLYSISADVKVGEEIKAGTKIGVMGNTGNSGGTHLHFELRDKDMNYLSANPFFGYSDQGYEDCLNPNSSIDNVKCDFDYTGSARYIGQSGFAQACGRTSNYSNNGDNSNCCTNLSNSNEAFSEQFIEYINAFEGKGRTCQTNTGANGYLAENLGDGAITAGHGITNSVVRNEESQKIIASSGYQNQFSLVGNRYIMTVGGCYNKHLIDQLQANSIKNSFGASVLKSAEKNNVQLQSYEIDALTSFNYNLGSGYIDKLITGFKTGGYEGLWNVMKEYMHSNGQELDGLKRRRKAEFALFVTGDYTDKGLFYSRGLKDYDNFDSENVIARKATGSSSSCDVGNSSNNDVVARAIEEMEKWQKISSDNGYCENITKYMSACGLNGVNDYCAGFVTYILKETGQDKKIGLPSYSCAVGNFKNVTNGTIHKPGSNYIPKPGDLIVYNGTGSSGTWGHIEIVEKVEGKSVYSIGGNTTGPKGLEGYCGKGNIQRRLPVDLSDSSITAYISY